MNSLYFVVSRSIAPDTIFYCNVLKCLSNQLYNCKIIMDITMMAGNSPELK